MSVCAHDPHCPGDGPSRMSSTVVAAAPIASRYAVMSASSVTVTCPTPSARRTGRPHRIDRTHADWRALVAVERGTARAYVDQVVREAWDRYGWDWPGPIRPTVRAPWPRMVLLRDVADPARPTLAELRGGVDLTGMSADDEDPTYEMPPLIGFTYSPPPPEPPHPVAAAARSGRPVYVVQRGRVVGEVAYSIAEMDPDWWGDQA